MIDMPRNKLLKEIEITDKILDIFYHQVDFTTSDLQSAIQAQVHNAITYKDQ